MQHDQAAYYASHRPTTAKAHRRSKTLRLQHSRLSGGLGVKGLVRDLLSMLKKFIKRRDVMAEVMGDYPDPVIGQLQNMTQVVQTSTSHSRMAGIKADVRLRAQQLLWSCSFTQYLLSFWGVHFSSSLWLCGR